MTVRGSLLVSAALFLCGCGGPSQDTGPSTGPLQVGMMTTQPVDWSAGQGGLGKVAAVVDVADQVAVFSGGTLTGGDNSVTAWRAAAAVPALGVMGTWLLGVDGSGRLYRARGVALEEVTASYALTGRPVSAVAPLSQAAVAFALDQTVAVADGKALTTYKLPPQGLSAGGGRVAVVDGGSVQVLTPAGGALQRYDVAGVKSAAFDLDGHLVLATDKALYQEKDGGMEQIYEAPAPIGGLAVSGSGIWVALGDRLALLKGGQLLLGQSGTVPAGAQLVGSPSGDVWLIAAGQLSRQGPSGGTSADETLWRQTMLPIFNRVCRACHLPGGIANLDLSGYDAWTMRRALIGQLVLTGKPTPMPPAGAGTLTDAEKAALQTWVNNNGT